MSAAWLAERAPRYGAAMLVVGAVMLNAHHLRKFDNDSIELERFMLELRAEIDAMPPGGTIYVVNSPFNRYLGKDTHLRSAVDLYYADVKVEQLSRAQATAIRETLPPEDRVFIFNE
jgi:hypothetical protein